jgi:CPA2 family monovalent cation:H+ antiporter-2
VRAGAELIVEALARSPKHEHTRAMLEVTRLLPGLGDVTMVRIAMESPGAERQLRELNLRARSGASVVAIVRGDERITLPGETELLHGGDLVALTGTPEAVERAMTFLAPRAPVRARE